MISRILIGILIISLSSCVGVTVTEARNEYLNNGTNTCSTGSFDISVEQRESEYYHRPYDPANAYSNPSDDQSLRLTWRKYLGSACTKEFKEVYFQASSFLDGKPCSSNTFMASLRRS